MTNWPRARQWAAVVLLVGSTTQTNANTSTKPETVDSDTLNIYWDGDIEYTPQCSSGRGLVTAMTPTNVPTTLELDVTFVHTANGTYKVTSQLTNTIDGTRAIEQYTNEGFRINIQYLCLK
ncbi:MAG: hypothetical protein AAGJ88_16455 [Pseudomonadota bacterium]